MADPIKRILVDALLPLPDGSGSQICWELNKQFCNRPLEYAVLVSDNPKGPFQNIGTTRDTMFIDPAERRYGLNTEVYYTIYTRDIHTDERWKGIIQRVGSAWERREWRLAREITRQEYVRLRKGHAGSRGWLLNRRTSGELCSCVSPDTGQVNNPNCPNCYGTKYEGGYYGQLECWVDMNPQKTMRRITGEQGYQAETISLWRIMAYPNARANDVWVDAMTDWRWRIMGEETVIGHIRGLPIIKSVRVERIDRNDPVYEYPIDDRP